MTRSSLLALPRRQASPFRDGTVRMLPEDVAGELDTPLVDRAYPRWTSSNLAEAFPGPMTALSLGLSLQCMRASAASFASMLPLSAELADDNRRHLLASFGHTIYVNIELLRRMISLTNQTPDEFDHQIFGTPLPPGYRRPRPSLATVRSLARVGVSMGPRVVGLGREIRRMEQLASTRVAETPAHLDDVGLQARLDVLWDELVYSWTVANLTSALVSQPIATIEQRHGGDAAAAVRSGVENLESAGAASGVRRLAEAARHDPAAAAAFGAGDRRERLERVRAEAPAMAALLADVVARYGHRGPGETELANEVYADDPALLLDAAAKLFSRDVHAPSAPVRRNPGRSERMLARRAVAASLRRERSRDAVVRLTHAARLTVREIGARLAAGGLIEQRDDVFHLRREELRDLPGDAQEVIGRRRAERARLQALRLPVVLDGPWSPPGPGADDAPVRLHGVGASPGIAIGRVRVLADSLAELEPDEILVARVTDVGWTPFFAVASAVVTDAGGFMAHAAVVARELGIPAVVGTNDATRFLRDGQLVEVDGRAGTVTVLAPDSVASAS